MTRTANIGVEDLKPNTKIVEFTKFAKPYANMEEKICKFIQHNLKGASAEVERGGKKVTCQMTQLKAGDTMIKVFDLPTSLSKLTTVSKGLIPELKKRGFLGFTVELIEKKPSTKQEKRQASVQEANQFIQKIKQSIIAREEATDTARNMLDSARKGKPSAEEVKSNIDNVMGKSSPEAMTAIASLQSSDQTYAHCVDAAAIFQTAYYAIKKKKKEKPIFEDEKMAMFGAFMHDFGKAKVPKDILESTVRFERESKEMHLLQSHPKFGAELLAGMGMPDFIVNMAHYHHVKVDTSLNSSYPQGVKYDDVIMEARLVSIVDVYQALIGRRSYKKSWAPAAAIRYIDALAGAEFDDGIWEDFVSVMGIYPKGSLVEMSDGTIGFVMNVPDDDLERPEVVIFRDADGKDFEKPTLVDLAEEQDLEIEQDLDHYEVLGDDAMDIFLQLEVR
ncbi:MAG: HD domain-containing protein [SAR324 cluster bacterium]|nr:HD domain-containing protein [SAR324 cluster bacterium]